MEFTNSRIEPDELPDYSAVELQPVALAFYPYSMLGSVMVWGGVAAASAVARWLPWLEWLPGWWLTWVLLAMIPAGMIWDWLDARRRGWALREHDIIYRQGVINHTTTILPFARIQHVETVSGPVERMFGLMRLKCYTAGGMTADLTLAGLDRQSARRVRTYLLERIRGPVA